jgi:hypothetical protein
VCREFDSPQAHHLIFVVAKNRRRFFRSLVCDENIYFTAFARLTVVRNLAAMASLIAELAIAGV